MTMTVTGHDYERMSWHQRSHLNERLMSETRNLLAEVDNLDTQIRHRRAALISDTIGRRESTDAAAHFAQARAILHGLTPDPNAAQHRLELDRALRPARKEDAA